MRSAAVVLRLLALWLVAGGCGAQKQMIPSALDTQAVDVKAEPGPADLPPRSTGVPADSILEMLQWIARSDGRELLSQRWWDFEGDRFRWDTFGDPSFMGEGSSTTVSDAADATILFSGVSADGSTVSYDAYTGELRGSPEEDQTTAHDAAEEWGTKDVVLLGRQVLDHTEADVYRLDLNIGHGQERSADFGLVYVNAATGLRLREEWLLGSPGDAWVYHLYDYSLLPRTPELEAHLSTQALMDLAEQNLQQRLTEVGELDFPVWSIPEGAHGLTLSGAMLLKGDDGTRVRLSYVPKESLGPAAVTIETSDVRERPDFPRVRLMPREEAVAYSGGTDHIDFRMVSPADASGTIDYDTSVRILLGAESEEPAEPLVLGTLAMELVDMRHTDPH